MSKTDGTRSLRSVLRDTDAEHFVGREAELRIVAELIDRDTPSRILFVHGPGGIGKSALLRAAQRLAERAGLAIASHDARTLTGGLDNALAQLAGPSTEPRLIVIDEVDHLGSMLAPLRDALIDRLGADARIVLAGRGEPEQSWHADGLPHIVIDLPLGPLADDRADAYLAGRGIADPQRRARIVAWARGYPLALTVAAGAPSGRGGIGLEAHLEERLTAWLAGHVMLDVDPEVLEVAAVARIVDGRLLAAALPGRNTRELFRRLQALPVVQPLGGGSSLHPVLADVSRDRLKATAPARYRQLVRRVAEHLATRARLGDMDALIELSLLIENPLYREAIANEPSRSCYPDQPRPGEFEDFGRRHGFDGGTDWVELVTWRRVGAQDLVLRRNDGEVVLWDCLAPLIAVPEIGPVTASLVAAGRRIEAVPSRSFAAVTLFADVSIEERAEASRLSSGAFMRYIAMPELETLLMHFPAPDRRPGPNAAVGLELTDGARAVAVSDFRPRGAVGFVEAIVLAEQGFGASEPGNAELLAQTEDPEREGRLRAVLADVFGDSADDRRLRAVMEAAHLGPRRGEAALLAEFHVGRSTWYRLLRTARERVLAHR